jgi:tetratricopeptide (TPR) repeat protein
MEKKSKAHDTEPDSSEKTTPKKSNDEEIDLSNPEFVNVWNLLSLTDRSVFLTGKAGTGKSTFLRYIKNNLKKKIVILAPTGIAAVNVGGQTIHSFFKLPFKPLLPDDPDFKTSILRKRMKYSSAHIKLLRRVDLIIIDEISMVRADTIDFIDKVLRVYCQNMKQPFGGKQMLFVGDIFQLEPVLTGDTRDLIGRYYSAPYFFNAHVFNKIGLVPIELNKVYRQDEPEFIAMLDRVRDGSPSQADIMALNSRLGVKPTAQGSDMTMTIATRREIVDNINDTELEAIKRPERLYEGEIKNDFPENSLPTDKTLRLKVGAQVVFVKNDMERRWVNGTMAKVLSMDDDKIMVELENGVKHNVEREIWTNLKFVFNEKTKSVDEIELGSFTQFPLKLAWALTIHKSQGLTFNNVIIDLGRGAFTGGQTYVALSRCRSMEGIGLRNTVNERDIYVNPVIKRFSRTFNDPRIYNDAVEASRADALLVKAMHEFNKGDINAALDAFFEGHAHKNILNDKSIQRLIKSKFRVFDKMKERISELEAQVEKDKHEFEKLATNYVSLGDDCSDAMEYDAALSNYNRALELAPDYYPALLAKGLLMATMGLGEDALDALEAAAKACPTDFKPLVAMGDVERSLGDMAAAMEHYLHAIDLNGKVISTHSRVVELYESIGDEEQAAIHRRIIAHLQKKSKK